MNNFKIYYFALLLGIGVILLPSCNRNPINAMFEDVKDNETDVFAITIPGWLIKKGVQWGLKNKALENDLSSIQQLTGGIKKVRVLFTESLDNPSFKSHLDKSVSNLSKYNFSPYVYVRDNDARVSVWGKEKGDRLNDLFVYINSDDETALVHIETDINLDDFNKFSQTITRPKTETK